MSEEFLQRLRKKPSDHDGDTGVSHRGNLRPIRNLDCPEHQMWRAARANERRALQERGVMRVVPTPAGVKPLKSRYVCKRKYNNKNGSIKKYKSRLVGSSWLWSDVDVYNTFAPVVKSVTVRLL